MAYWLLKGSLSILLSWHTLTQATLSTIGSCLHILLHPSPWTQPKGSTVKHFSSASKPFRGRLLTQLISNSYTSTDFIRWVLVAISIQGANNSWCLLRMDDKGFPGPGICSHMVLFSSSCKGLKNALIKIHTHIQQVKIIIKIKKETPGFE